MNYRDQYYRLASLLSRAGLIDSKEITVIARRGTRKEMYYGRHLRDLRAITERRLIGKLGSKEKYMGYFAQLDAEMRQYRWGDYRPSNCECGSPRMIVNFYPPNTARVICRNEKCTHYNNPKSIILKRSSQESRAPAKPAPVGSRTY